MMQKYASVANPLFFFVLFFIPYDPIVCYKMEGMGERQRRSCPGVSYVSKGGLVIGASRSDDPAIPDMLLRLRDFSYPVALRRKSFKPSGASLDCVMQMK